MIGSQDVYELSSDEEVPKKACGSRDWGAADVICLDEESEPAAASKLIAITIKDSHVRSLSESTKITIEFEGTSSQSNADNNIIKKDIETRRVQVHQTCEQSKKIRRVDLISQPKHETVKETQNNKTINGSTQNMEEFSKCYTDFMNVCLEADSSQDMQVIMEKKVKRYYRKADERYVRSQEFEGLVADKAARLRSSRQDMWVHIKDVVDALRAHRKNSSNPTQSAELALEPSRQQEVEQLEGRLQVLRRVVRELEDAELDFEQEELSVYVRVDKYKAQLVSVHERLCRLRGVRASSHSRMRIERSAGRAPGPAARLEQWVNAPVAGGQPPRFPDFHDVVACVRDACRTHQLDWSDAQVMREARELFTQCGRALQQLRQRREWRLAASHLPGGAGDADPADASAELQATLRRNRTIARQREQQVFDEFETKQMLGTYLPKSKVSSANKTDLRNAEESIEGPENKTEVPHTVETIQESIPHESDSKIIEKKCDSEKGIDLTDDKSKDGDVESCVEAPRREPSLNPDSDCEVLSSDDCSSDSLRKSSSVRMADRLSDDDIERFSVSDSSVCSEQDSLHLLRRVEARRGAGLNYSTRVSTSPTTLSSSTSSSSDCDSDGSACVLVQSDHDTDSS